MLSNVIIIIVVMPIAAILFDVVKFIFFLLDENLCFNVVLFFYFELLVLSIFLRIIIKQFY